MAESKSLRKYYTYEVSHDRVKPLLKLFVQGGWGGLYNFCIGHHLTTTPAQLAPIVVKPHNVAPYLKLLFLKNNIRVNNFSVKFFFAFNPEILYCGQGTFLFLWQIESK